ncbi:MAG: hypothetical protein IBJ00_03860, partial [Alphaproteobacteria bacterium]|nr:hypothetical protein [Alphaproteobacteria bacterium]
MKSYQFFICLLFSCTLNLQVAISSDDESTSLMRHAKGKEREDLRGSNFKNPANPFQSATYT